MTQEEADFKADVTNREVKNDIAREKNLTFFSFLYRIIYKIDFSQSRASAISEIRKFVSGTSEITFAALLKLIDEDLLPKENSEWARSVTNDMKKYLLVRNIIFII